MQKGDSVEVEVMDRAGKSSWLPGVVTAVHDPRDGESFTRVSVQCMSMHFKQCHPDCVREMRD